MWRRGPYFISQPLSAVLRCPSIRLSLQNFCKMLLYELQRVLRCTFWVLTCRKVEYNTSNKLQQRFCAVPLNTFHNVRPLYLRGGAVQPNSLDTREYGPVASFFDYVPNAIWRRGSRSWGYYYYYYYYYYKMYLQGHLTMKKKPWSPENM